jgi:O-antigen ligase
MEAPDPGRSLAFALALALVFLRFSMLHQIQMYLLPVNLRLLYVVGIPAILGMLLAGGLRRSFQGRTAVYWVAFVAWMALAAPFSIWKGHSVSVWLEYVRTNLPMLFVIAGLAVTWRQCRMVMYAIAWGGAVNLLSARLFRSAEYGGRMSLDVGTTSDPNDYAAHLLLVLPFLLWVVLSARPVILRVMAALGIGYGLYLVLGTASRGALVGLSAEVLFFLIRGTARQRIALLALAPIGAAILLVVVPQSALTRIRSFTDGGPSEEALQSTESREYLLRKSVAYTFQHPILGVGPGEFAEYEGRENRLPGMTHGYWHETHNTYTQISSECGIPALLFFLAGIGSTFALFHATYRQARKRPDCRDIRTAVFCITLGYAGFCVAIAFLNFGYFFYFPAMGGLAIAVRAAARREIQTRGVYKPPAPPQMAVPSDTFLAGARLRNRLRAAMDNSLHAARRRGKPEARSTSSFYWRTGSFFKTSGAAPSTSRRL